MKKMGKRMIACILLVTTLMCGTMTVFAAECNHNWIKVSRISVSNPYGCGSQMNHKVKEKWIERCTSCNDYREMTYEVAEGHNWYKYESIKHYDLAHDYRIYCSGCGENYVISVPCNNNGSHSTPW